METATPATSVPVLLDTDIGTNVDDALALAYLLRHPRCELLGVTTVSGDVVRRAACAEAVCVDAGRADVPVVPGAPGPLLMGTGQAAVPLYAAVASRRRALVGPGQTPGTGVEFLRQAIRARPGEITLLTIGPLTNVALLFAVDPEIPSMLKSIVSMAGVYFPHERAVETNVVVDPFAAAMVFQATGRAGSAPHTLVGLNVTTRLTQPAEEFRRTHAGAVPPSPALLEMAEVAFRKRRHVTFNDPLAATVVFAPDVCTYEAGQVTMTVGGRGEEAARTYFAPDRAAAAPRASNHRVARGVRPERFFDEYFGALCPAVRPGGFLPPASRL